MAGSKSTKTMMRRARGEGERMDEMREFGGRRMGREVTGRMRRQFGAEDGYDDAATSSEAGWWWLCAFGGGVCRSR